MSLINAFKISNEREEFEIVNDNIHKGVEFSGVNLWILIFAILIASLGLNINSTAVVIGAMLISPIMGPIIGLGFGMAINDLSLLRKSFFSYLFCAVIGLTASTLFFLLSPINYAESEILSRTSPNIYDVLIALFGGLAGILAITTKTKGNVIPGVAISTALMPPLCVAGFGLSTSNFNFFFGALYLFIINSVFIALATIITTRYLKFPYKIFPEKKAQKKAKRIVWAIAILTVLPSLYLGYDMIRQNKFQQNALNFIAIEAQFQNDYILKQEIDADKRTITLTYGGNEISENSIASLREKLDKYELKNTKLIIQQGFSFLKKDDKNIEINPLTLVIAEKDKKINQIQTKLDSIRSISVQGKQIYKELKVYYPQVDSYMLTSSAKITDSTDNFVYVSIIRSKKDWSEEDKSKISNWLKVRLKKNKMEFYFE